MLARFRQGTVAAIPIWIAFVPSSIAWGIAAQRHGLSFNEAILMSAWVYSGPAQFAVLAPLAENKSAVQVLIAGFLMNLRFLPMSTALAPFFRGVKRMPLLISSHVISASSFIVPYVQFQKERASSEGASIATPAENGYRNLMFFLGVGITSFVVWVTGREPALALPWDSPIASTKRCSLYCRGILLVCWSSRRKACRCCLSASVV